MSDSWQPQTIAQQAPLSMGFPMQEYWSGLPFPFPGYFPNPGIDPTPHALEADSLPDEPSRKLENEIGKGTDSLPEPAERNATRFS